ncbi:hypothetical protein QBC37DRAFT_409065, partial [Rhypophila decipiens]
MAETPNPPAYRSSTKAPKDRKCQYCNQDFTSSSLGRHLDQFIKPKNPKAPDGVHDVEQIRRAREGITRRHVARRDTSASGSTPAARSKKSSVSEDPESPSAFKSPVSAKGFGLGSTSGRAYPSNTPWTATGVKNDIPNNEHGPKKEPTRQPNRSHFGDKKDKQDLEDKARAAELALSEIIGSFRAARQHLDIKSIPFEVNPLNLDFPALVLRFLDAPGTLFASIQTPTSTSWSIEPPGKDQLNSLKSYFTETIRKRKTTLAAALTAVSQALTYPPSDGPIHRDAKEELLQAEGTLSSLEGELIGHLDNTFETWRELRVEDRELYWRLELARGVSRNHAQVHELKKTEHSLRQEINKLRSQIDQLEHLQQPREFKTMHPSTVQFSKEFVSFLEEDSIAHPRDDARLLLADPSLDLTTVVSKYIARWMEAIQSSRLPNAGSSSQQLAGRADSGGSEKGALPGAAHVVMTSPGEWQSQANTVEEQRRPTSLQHQALGNKSQFDKLSSAQPISSDGSADPPAGSGRNQDADEDPSDDDCESDGEPDADADGDEDEDANSGVDADADADGDTKMGGASAYQGMNTSSEGLSQQQQYVLSPQLQRQQHPQPQAEISSQNQPHLLSPQQHHQQAIQMGAARTRPTGPQGRFNPYSVNKNNPAAVAPRVPHGNSSLRMLNRSVSANTMAAFHGLGGDGGGAGGLVHHPQYLTGHGNNDHFTNSGVGQGQHMGRGPDTTGAGQAMGQVISQEPMYTNSTSVAPDGSDSPGNQTGLGGPGSEDLAGWL